MKLQAAIKYGQEDFVGAKVSLVVLNIDSYKFGFLGYIQTHASCFHSNIEKVSKLSPVSKFDRF